jgi:hypothetical protein
MDNDVYTPAALLARQQLDSGVSAERLRHEQEQAHINELYLLARSATSWSPSTAASSSPTSPGPA